MTFFLAWALWGEWVGLASWQLSCSHRRCAPVLISMVTLNETCAPESPSDFKTGMLAQMTQSSCKDVPTSIRGAINTVTSGPLPYVGVTEGGPSKFQQRWGSLIKQRPFLLCLTSPSTITLYTMIRPTWFQNSSPLPTIPAGSRAGASLDRDGRCLASFPYSRYTRPKSLRCPTFLPRIFRNLY